MMTFIMLVGAFCVGNYLGRKDAQYDFAQASRESGCCTNAHCMCMEDCPYQEAN